MATKMNQLGPVILTILFFICSNHNVNSGPISKFMLEYVENGCGFPDYTYVVREIAPADESCVSVRTSGSDTSLDKSIETDSDLCWALLNLQNDTCKLKSFSNKTKEYFVSYTVDGFCTKVQSVYKVEKCVDVCSTELGKKLCKVLNIYVQAILAEKSQGNVKKENSKSSETTTTSMPPVRAMELPNTAEKVPVSIGNVSANTGSGAGTGVAKDVHGPQAPFESNKKVEKTTYSPKIPIRDMETNTAQVLNGSQSVNKTENRIITPAPKIGNTELNSGRNEPWATVTSHRDEAIVNGSKATLFTGSNDLVGSGRIGNGSKLSGSGASGAGTDMNGNKSSTPSTGGGARLVTDMTNNELPTSGTGGAGSRTDLTEKKQPVSGTGGAGSGTDLTENKQLTSGTGGAGSGTDLTEKKQPISGTGGAGSGTGLTEKKQPTSGISGAGSGTGSTESKQPTSDTGGPGSEPDLTENKQPTSSTGGAGSGTGLTEKKQPISGTGGALGSGTDLTENKQPTSSTGGAGSGTGLTEKKQPISGTGGAGSGTDLTEKKQPTSGTGGAGSGTDLTENKQPTSDTGGAGSGTGMTENKPVGSKTIVDAGTLHVSPNIEKDSSTTVFTTTVETTRQKVIVEGNENGNQGGSFNFEGDSKGNTIPDTDFSSGNKWSQGNQNGGGLFVESKGDTNKEPSSGNFMAYFLTAVVLCVAGYVLFHNKQKIVAFIVEGRNGRRAPARRPKTSDYKKLQSNVEEVMPSLEKSTTGSKYIY